VIERLTDRSRRVLEFSQDEAGLLGHNFIGTEHLLLGLLRETDCVAAHCLRQLGVSLPAVRQMLTAIRSFDPALIQPRPFTARSKKVLELSLREARQFGHKYIATEHILLGLIREGEGVAVQILQSLGVAPSRVRAQVLSFLNGSDPASGESPSTHPAAPFEGHTTPPLIRDGSRRALPGVSDWARFATKVLPGPEQALGSDGLYFRVVGVLLYEERLQVLWRLSGIPKPIADWMRNPAAFSPALQNERSVAFVAVRDDVGTDYTVLQPRMAAQSETEWAGSSIFAPAMPASALRLTVVWQEETIDIGM
jgi:hypothetical protein